MAHTRSFKVVNRKLAGWSGGSKCVRIYRHRGKWAFYDGQGFFWYQQTGFKSELAATCAAAKWMGKGFRLTRDIDSAACSPRPPRFSMRQFKEKE